jgi:hypothetical protein
MLTERILSAIFSLPYTLNITIANAKNIIIITTILTINSKGIDNKDKNKHLNTLYKYFFTNPFYKPITHI